MNEKRLRLYSYPLKYKIIQMFWAAFAFLLCKPRFTNLEIGLSIFISLFQSSSSELNRTKSNFRLRLELGKKFPTEGKSHCRLGLAKPC
jgi:hypothetical protein